MLINKFISSTTSSPSPTPFTPFTWLSKKQETQTATQQHFTRTHNKPHTHEDSSCISLCLFLKWYNFHLFSHFWRMQIHTHQRENYSKQDAFTKETCRHMKTHATPSHTREPSSQKEISISLDVIFFSFTLSPLTWCRKIYWALHWFSRSLF